ncbi:glycosyltransferase [Candidatus Nomurabacteria bacterium]|nr:glycosyltransferase [Candidatus Nomurabacteria bacterium]
MNRYPDDYSPKVSFVVLSYNSSQYLEACLKSIKRQTYQNWELIVVDNNSSDDSSRIVKELDFVDSFYQNTANSGYAEGQRIALGLISPKSEWVALINADSILDEQWLMSLIDFLRGKQYIGAIRGASYPYQDHFKSAKRTDPKARISYQSIDPLTAYTSMISDDGSRLSVNNLAGDAVLVNLSVSQILGYFDSDFFAYYEETDLFARIKRHGWNLSYTPEAASWHLGRGSNISDEFYYYLIQRNRFRYAVKNFDTSYLVRFLFYYYLETFYFLRIIYHNHRDKYAIASLRAIAVNTLRFFTTLRSRKEVVDYGYSYSTILEIEAMADITIVITCYNKASYIKQAIDSALSQSYAPAEVIVIDDCSTDSSRDLIQEFQGRVTIIDNAKNLGVSKVKNMAIDQAKTKYLVILDGDDYLEPDYLRQLGYKIKHETLDVVYSAAWHKGERDNISPIPATTSILKLLERNYINSSALLNLEFVKGMNIRFDQDMKLGAEDWEFFLQMMKSGARFGSLGQALINIRINSQGVNSKFVKNFEQVNDYIKGKHRLLFGLRGLYVPVIYLRRGLAHWLFLYR